MAPLIDAGGISQEPALSICNNTLQSLLSSPYDWKFNKGSIPPFTTIPYQQDYVLSGCQMIVTTASTPPVNVCVVHLNAVNSANGAGLTESGTTVTALFSDFAPNGTFGLNGPPGSTPVTSGTSVPQVGQLVTITGASQAGYNVTNAVITATPLAANGGILSVQFTAAGGLTSDGGQGIGDSNWISHCTLEDFMNTATVRPVHDIEVVSSLYPESIIQPPFKLCLLTENVSNLTAGGQLTTLTFRFWPVPSSQIWRALIFYQLKAPIKTSLLNTWSPWPDNLAYALNSGVKAQALEWFEDPRAPMAEAKFQQDVLKCLDIKDQEARSESYFPDMPLLRGG